VFHPTGSHPGNVARNVRVGVRRKCRLAPRCTRPESAWMSLQDWMLLAVVYGRLSRALGGTESVGKAE
jgi:hypothetical protein